MVRIVDEINTPSLYSPLLLSGLSLEYSEMKATDTSIVTETFYPYFRGGKKSIFENELRRWLASSPDIHLLLVKAGDTPVCLAVYEVQDSVMIARAFVVNERFFERRILSTFIKRMAFKLLDEADKLAANRIEIVESNNSTQLIDAMGECGYYLTAGTLQKNLVREIKEPKTLAQLSILPDDHVINKAIRIYQHLLQKGCVPAANTIELEKALWPLKLDDDNVPCYIVPIQAEYAKELFDEDLANTNLSLFINEKTEPALSIENVYYKSSRNSVKLYPARILWYVSNNNMIGSAKVRACSYLDMVEVGDAKRIYKKYRRLGVLEWKDLQRMMSKDNRIAAYTFSYTELFSNPVELDIARTIIGKPKETFQSFTQISSSEYLQIYKKGKL